MKNRLIPCFESTHALIAKVKIIIEKYPMAPQNAKRSSKYVQKVLNL